MQREPHSLAPARPHEILGAGKVLGRLLRLGQSALGKDPGPAVKRVGLTMRWDGPGTRGKATGLKDPGVARVSGRVGAKVPGLLSMSPGKGWGKGRLDCPDYPAWRRQLFRSCRFRSHCCRCG